MNMNKKHPARCAFSMVFSGMIFSVAIFSMLVVPAAPLAAQASAPAAGSRVTLTLEQALEYALKNSPSLQSAQLDLVIKARAKNLSWNIFLPSANATFTASRSNEANAQQSAQLAAMLPSYKSGEADNWALNGGISLSLNLSLAMIEQMRGTVANYEAGKITWDQTVAQTQVNITKLFYSLLLMQESLHIQEESLEAANSRALQAQANFRDGRVPEIQRLQAQVAYENQKPQVLKQRQTFEQNLETFAFLLGMKVGTKIELSGSIAPKYVNNLNADTLITQHLGKRFDLQVLDKNIKALQINRNALNLQAYTPALSLGWGWSPSAAVPMLQHSKDVEKAGKDVWSDGGSLTITLAFNLTNALPFSTMKQNELEVRDNIRKLQISRSMAEDSARKEIMQLVDNLTLSRSQIEASSANIDMAQRAYDMTLLSYRNGTTELLELRDAENSLNQARLGLLNEQFNYMSGILDLEYALNTQLK
ncbi:MAG: hypothetical protein Ta2A_16620 [Treponemataceae bacterium]|nr:MAG: hypothetical protein Ta2A_16620 [Treponemataceae bacterium]